MKKFIFWFLIILSVASIAYFIGYPYISKRMTPITDEKETNVNLQELSENSNSFIKEGWVEPEIFVYQRRDIPSLEADFTAKGYPQFLYVTDEDGKLNQKCEKSFHEQGMEVYLFMDDTFYLTNARIEYGVQKTKFNSTSMSDNIPPLIDFIQIITNRAVSSEDQNNLLRMFTNLFNDPESKNNTIKINDHDFTIKLDSFYNLIIISC